MQSLQAWWTGFAAGAYAHTLGGLAIVFVLGTLIGLERQWRQQTAGLRTNVLAAVGAAAFSDLGLRLPGTERATRIISHVVSGIGFLGAGVILKDGTNIRGLNTAATLWCSAAPAPPGQGHPFKPYLRERVTAYPDLAGSQLHREIRDLGYGVVLPASRNPVRTVIRAIQFCRNGRDVSGGGVT